MKAYGRKQMHHNLPDYHPPKGYCNWWEKEIDEVNKAIARRNAKKEIEEILSDIDDDSKWEKPIRVNPKVNR